jgi:hypothetical protein
MTLPISSERGELGGWVVVERGRAEGLFKFYTLARSLVRSRRVGYLFCFQTCENLCGWQKLENNACVCSCRRAGEGGSCRWLVALRGEAESRRRDSAEARLLRILYSCSLLSLSLSGFLLVVLFLCT